MTNKSNKIKRFIGSIIIVTSIVCICDFYDWKLALLIIGVVTGNNLERQ